MRIPILIWGDLQLGKKAVIRRSLAGNRAHECMYAWVYLTEYFAIKRLTDKITLLKSNVEQTQSALHDFDSKAWQVLDRSAIDPHFQVNKTSFDVSVLLNALVYSNSIIKPSAQIVELGQTFFTAIDKYKLVKLFSADKFDTDNTEIRWVGLDNSEFCNLTAVTLHPEMNKSINIFNDWSDFQADEGAIFHSRFVCSYAFQTTNQLVDYLVSNYSSIILEDAYSFDGTDFVTENHGQKQVFMHLEKLINKMICHGYDCHILDYYGDYPADAGRCLVVKMIFMKQADYNFEKLITFLTYHNLNINLKSTESVVKEMLSSINKKDWREIESNKKVNPVWGKTEKSTLSKWQKFKNRINNKLKLRATGYKSYNPTSINVEEEILRHLRDGH
ncbi:MAG: hypothetical protein COA74_02295 [Gammaproteobacteria bacterium]|nr:MAG: hypothetical protein COA74_02295 [Gammaproteobacteria bacterium]